MQARGPSRVAAVAPPLAASVPSSAAASALLRLGRWPLPALLAWAAGWAVFTALRAAEAPAWLALAIAAATGPLLAADRRIGTTPWRKSFIALGFPLSLALGGAAGGMPALAWLGPLLLLGTLYPVRAWRDAPMFPTPAGALRGLHEAAPLAETARLLDAGCGLGDGLLELARAYPGREVTGIEGSWPLSLAARWRCRGRAAVRQGDFWRADWSGLALVYLFQRPETMARAWQKARDEIGPGGWLASLEFPVPGVTPTARLDGAAGRPVWLYRVPGDQPGECRRATQ